MHRFRIWESHSNSTDKCNRQIEQIKGSLIYMARTRKKKNIPQRMKACSTYWFPVPVANRGRWRVVCCMAPDAQLYLELGCGKGDFAVQMAQRYPEICYIALEKDESVVLAAIEKASNAGVRNLFFIWTDAALLKNFFEEGEIDRIYINFCDPWSRKDKPKRRLTYREYLDMYKNLLNNNGEIHFKTDDKTLFDFSLSEFTDSSLTLHNQTSDLHNSRWDSNNIRTEFEQKFASQGITICRVEAHKAAQSGK